MKASTSFLLAAASLLPAIACAQAFSVNPGLWEHKLDMRSESGRLEQALELARVQMALLPPEQRKMVEDMLTRQGIQFDLVNQSFQNCITEEEASTGEFEFAEQGGCEQTSVTQSGTSTQISFVCDQGQGELALENGSEYTGHSTMVLDFNGITENVTATHSGRWLGASCAALGQ